MEHTIQNFDALAANDLRRDALTIAEAGYAAVDVGNALRRKLRRENDVLHIGDRVYPLAERRVTFVGVGKCAFAAAEAIEKMLGDRLADGIALDVSPTKPTLVKIEAYTGTHPLPSEENQHATERIFALLADRHDDDLIIFLISGGGSTLLCSYEAPLTSADESILFKELTEKGAPIQELNTVRKHLSRARGGGLARAAYPAEVISLIVSDVPGNDIEFISSGPTVRDTSTAADAEAVLARYSIALPPNTSFIETEKGENYFARVATILFLTNEDALAAMKETAVQQGYVAHIIDDHFSGEASVIGLGIAEKLHNAPPKTAFLYAGESTVTLPASADKGGPASLSQGGRNQEMALATLANVQEDEIVLAFASDGHDNTDHAGAIGDVVSSAHAQSKNISPEEYLAAHRSYDFFSTTDDALITGYTGSNVSDLVVALKK